MKKINLESIIILFSTLAIIMIIIVLIFTIYNSSTSLSNNNNNNNNNNTTINNKVKDNEIDKKENKKNISIVETQISSFTTTIYDKDENRIHNIKLATEKLNNHIIKANEVFSFNQTIGSMGEKNGYKKATGFDSNGKKIKIAAGGMCQISSTIYNTALIANFQIIERHPHSSRVYYVPVDKDATVFYDSVDLKFKNTLQNDIKILATTDRKQCHYNI